LPIEIEFNDKESKDVSKYNGSRSGFKEDDESGEEDVVLKRGQGGRAISHLIEKKKFFFGGGGVQNPVWPPTTGPLSGLAFKGLKAGHWKN